VSGEPGLCAAPWVRVELDEGVVWVDGEPVPADGTLEGAYLAALDIVVRKVAVPLGRPVGVTVADGPRMTRHLLVTPDGSVREIDQLVREAHGEAWAVQVPARRRRLRWAPRRVLVGVAAVGLLGAAVTPLLSAIGDSWATPSDVAGVAGAEQAVSDEVTSAAAPVPVASSPPPSETPSGRPAGGGSLVVAPAVLSGSRLRARPLLAPTVLATAPGELTLEVPWTHRPAVATLRVVDSGGRVEVRRVRVRAASPARLVVAGLTPGAASWSLRAPEAIPAQGRVTVTAPPPPPPPTVPVATTPAPPAPPSSSGTSGNTSGGSSGGTSGGKSGGKSGGGSGGSSPPPVPVDPDDP